MRLFHGTNIRIEVLARSKLGTPTAPCLTTTRANAAMIALDRVQARGVGVALVYEFESAPPEVEFCEGGGGWILKTQFLQPLGVKVVNSDDTLLESRSA